MTNGEGYVCYKQVAPPPVARHPNSICQEIISATAAHPPLNDTSYESIVAPRAKTTPFERDVKFDTRGAVHILI